MDTNQHAANDFPPQARIAGRRSQPWWMLLPLAALLIVAVVISQQVVRSGVMVEVTVEHGHGLTVGSDLRHRGIPVGQVEAVTLTPDSQAVAVHLRLTHGAQHLAREGSLFWIVRPQLSISGAAGLDTVIGARYLAVLPGDGPPSHTFHGLNDPPVMADLSPGGLEISLNARERGSLNPGSPLLYRQVPVGRVLSVGLAPDSSSVMIRAYIEPSFRGLVRENTRFWNVSGIKADFGLGGLDLQIDSLSTLILGGIALATPTDPGAEVVAGHRFQLAERLDPSWRDWSPSLIMAKDSAEHLRPLPVLARAALNWQHSGWLGTSEQQRSGWLLVVDDGLLGCADLLTQASAADDHAITLSLAGQRFQLTDIPQRTAGGLAVVPLAPDWRPWPRQRLRSPTAVEDVLIIADPSGPPLLIAANRLSPHADGWLVDRALTRDRDWHGAVAVALADGTVIAIMDCSGSRTILRPIPQALLHESSFP